jgi:methyltransferase (TIGR00027 family)
MSTDQPPSEQASGTALAAAFLRALIALDPQTELRARDPLAVLFLTDDQKKSIADPKTRIWVIQNKLTPGTYDFIFARTAFFDQIVERALEENIPQIVLLGAGYDSRPYRFRDHLHDTLIFELDAPATQQRKRDCLQKGKIPIPDQIRFIPSNLGTDNLEEAFIHAGYNPQRRSLFVWEGVTYYLSRQVVQSVLAFVHANSPVGSSICFDYAALSDEALSETGTRELRKLMQTQYSQEPAKFGIPAGGLASFLASNHFSVIEHQTPEEINERYLSGRGHVPALFCFVHARTEP